MSALSGDAVVYALRRDRASLRRFRSNKFLMFMLLITVAVPGSSSQESPMPPRDRADVASRKHTTWTSLGLSGGGAMYMPSISPADPNLILLSCDMSGAYRSTDGGRNWELIHYRQLTSSTRVRPVWHPTLANIAYAVGGRGVLKTTQDKGQTWSTVPGAPAGVTAIAIDPARPQSTLIGNRGRIHRSTDAGKSWQEVGTVRGRVLGFHFDQTSPIQNRTCIAATDQGIFRSDDGGSKWREVATQLGPGPILSFAAGSNENSSECVLYCLAGTPLAASHHGGNPTVRRPGCHLDEGNSRRPRPAGRSPIVGPSAIRVCRDERPESIARVCHDGRRPWQSVPERQSRRDWSEMLFQSMNSSNFNVAPNYSDRRARPRRRPHLRPGHQPRRSRPGDRRGLDELLDHDERRKNVGRRPHAAPKTPDDAGKGCAGSTPGWS